MKAFHWALVIAALVFAKLTTPSHAQTATTAPTYAGTTFPSPPHQADPWTAPPTTLPANLISATASLFDQGLADPRGCEYRGVELVVGNVWSGVGAAVKTHAWVLPRAMGTNADFAVAWNGLVYPVVAVHDPADLSADVAALIAEDEKTINTAFGRLMHAFREEAAVSPQVMLPGRVCMLLRLGEGELAAQVWNAWTSKLPPQTNDNDAIRRDPYLQLAQDWAWAQFDRAVCAHMRGDHGLSIATARLLAAAQPLIETEAAKRGFERPLVLDLQNLNRNLPNPPYVGFLQALPALIADEQRRLDAGNVVRVLAHPEAYPEKPERIAALIRDLEEIEERQWIQPGSVNIADAPVIHALEKEGADAVEPLIECFAQDQRLTRSVRFGRDFHQGRELMTVSQSAYIALRQVLKTDQFGPLTSKRTAGAFSDRAAVAAELRAYWQASKSLSVEERWYRILADDSATPAQWLEMTARLTQPVDVESRGGWVNVPRRKVGEKVVVRGEPLRNQRIPSVSDLIARRIPPVAAVNNGWHFAIHDATGMSVAFSRWDPVAARPVLREQFKRCVDAFGRDDSDTKELMSRDLGRLAVAAGAAGDDELLRSYAAWLRTLEPADAGSNAAEAMAAIYRFPSNPDIANAAEQIFNDRASPWQNLMKAQTAGYSSFWGDLLKTPLIERPSMRKHLLRNLSNNDAVGEVWTKAGAVTMKLADGTEIGFGSAVSPDPLMPNDDRHTPFRVCDWYAWNLSQLEGTPVFELYWPLEKRNAVIASMQAFVRQYMDRFAYSDDQRWLWEDPSEPEARMVLPKLHRPATIEEVTAGRAIFSIAAESEPRTVSLENFPVRARWKTLKDFPVTQQFYNPQTKETGMQTSYQQSGLVWQAEEVLEAGLWKRYYGFVGAHIIAKVPAEEIELFPGNDPTTRPD